MTDVVVLGAGALGSIYGAALARSGCTVALLARGPHAAAISRSGLRLQLGDGETRIVKLHATSDPDELPPAEVVLVTAKAFDVPLLLESVHWQPRIVASVQNGVSKDDLLVERFGRAVVGCVSMVGGTLVSPGVVNHTLDGMTYLGPLASTTDDIHAELANLLRNGGLKAELRTDIESVVWSKAILAAAAMGVVGLTRLTYHRVFLNELTASLFHDLVLEGAAVAAAEGVELIDLPGPLQIRSLSTADRAAALARLRSVGEAFVEAGQTDIRVSVLQGIDSKRRTEVEVVHGEILARAHRHGIDVPVLETVTRVLRGIDAELEG
jgi:2-dehydropantoate 2-reductase